MSEEDQENIGRENANILNQLMNGTLSSSGTRADLDGPLANEDEGHSGDLLTNSSEETSPSVLDSSSLSTQTEELRRHFQQVRNDPYYRFNVKLRRRRAQELQRLLANPEAIDLQIFNKDVWLFESQTIWHGEKITINPLTLEKTLDAEQLAEYDRALDAGEMGLHGNYSWGAGSKIYGPGLQVSDQQKTALIQTALRILNRRDITPLDKAKQVMEIIGFGPNIATGLVMLYHPQEFAIFNKQSKEALDKLGLHAKSLEAFQEAVRRLKETVGADDFIELDWFLYKVNQQEVIENNPVTSSHVETDETPPAITAQTGFWKVAPGEEAHLWNRCLRDGIIAIGWPNLGDIRHLTRDEFTAKRDAAAQEYPDYTPDGMDQLWKFVHEIKPGDRIVTNKGFSRVLGMGVVTGPCEYKEGDGVHYRHRWPVRWYDTAPRSVQQGGWMRTLVKLNRETFESIEKAPRSEALTRYYKLSPYSTCWSWGECFSKKVALLGYDELGDVGEQHPKIDFAERVRNRSSQFNKADCDAVWTLSLMPRGSRIAAVDRDTGKVHGYGVTTGQYFYDTDAPRFRHRIPVEWQMTTTETQDTASRRKTLEEMNEDQWVALGGPTEAIPPAMSAAPSTTEENDVPPTMIEYPLNQILYGPPGTGKTYNTIDRAVEIIDSGTPGNHAACKVRFDELMSQGRIGFITFHQSYSYEDFVEGIRPVLDENTAAGAHYMCRDGILKEMTLRALGAALEPVEADRVTFDQLWDAFVERVESSPEWLLPGIGASRYRIAFTPSGNVIGENVEGRAAAPYNASLQNIRLVWERLAPGVKASHNILHEIIGKGAHTNLIGAIVEELRRMEGTLTPQTNKKLDTIEAAKSFLRGSGQYRLLPPARQPRFVLVIDEINRGNISKILGELITLIEDDKRWPNENALTVTLPYSGDRFALPSNLYLLGTMNTADKSLALVDVALRRRFEFQEMIPDLNICPGLTSPMRYVLRTLNERITLRKDREHRIGHAYFMKVHDTESFNEVFRRRVIPLLQEYFYNDWDGLRFVLGESKGREGFLRTLPGSQAAEARSKWQWCFDAEDCSPTSVDCLSMLLSNYPAEDGAVVAGDTDGGVANGRVSDGAIQQ